MNHNTCQLSITDSIQDIKLRHPSRRQSVSLIAETFIVTIATIVSVRFLIVGASKIAWLAVPTLLVIAAFIPSMIRSTNFVSIGISKEQIKLSLTVVAWACMFTFPILLLGQLILRSLGLALPMQPQIPQVQSWIYWLLYQFMYVAVAEEVFFRGYVQRNINRITDTFDWGNYGTRNLTCIILSATCFAAAHVIVQGQLVSFVTFLPGLVLGWLFVRTGSLLAPILFHGLANTFYFMLNFALAPSLQ
jgi:membrane protease YdiL (CAAX protease family)